MRPVRSERTVSPVPHRPSTGSTGPTVSALSSLLSSVLAAGLAAALLVPVLAAPATAQQAQQAQALPPVPAFGVTSDGDSIPQLFDWWRDAGVPARTPWGQAVDVASTEQILSWTTAPEYTTDLVDHLPDHPTVVSPTDHFGHPIGRPGVLHKVDEIHGYFEALAGSTDRVRFDYLGETEEGRRLAVAKVGSAENLARLEEIRAGLNDLADPRGTSAEEAERLIGELPAVYTFYAGLHSPETGPPEMVMEMAYRLAASDHPTVQQIRDEVVVFIVPVSEPDGRDRVVDWHRRYNAETYSTEDRVSGPPYWGKYIFHDNNRDGLQQSARLTQELTQLFLDWRYPVGHDLHESVPYLYVSTGTGPYNPTVDPITVSEWQWMSNFEVTQLTSEGLPGVWTHDFYTGWYPGYLLWVTNTRNAVGRFYETFGNSVPTTMVREVGPGRTSVEWFRPNPPRDSTLWSLRNNTNYMQSGALSALELVADNREKVLRNFWRKSLNSLEKGRTGAPYAYVIPADQERRADAAYMVELIRRQGIEVHRATESGTFGEGDAAVSVERGDYVVRMDQPFRNFVLTLMQRQDFPEDAPSPYDDVAWTYPLMFNVTAHAVDDAAVQSALDVEPVSGEVRIAGEVRGSGDLLLVHPRASARQMEARLALGDAPVEVARTEVTLPDGTVLPPGAWIVPGDAVADADGWARDHGLVAHRAGRGALGGVATHAMDMPRIALLHTWTRTQDEGWTRYALDQAGLDFDYVGAPALADAGDLRARWDVILFPHQGTGADAKGIFQGIDPDEGPLAYTRTPDFPSHGTPDSSTDMTGGLGFDGLAALADFVEDGGTLVAVGSAGTVPVELGIVRDVEVGSAGSAVIPGSILAATVENPEHPLVYGYDETFPVYHQFGPYWDVDDEAEAGVALRYADQDELLLSGVARNAGQVPGEVAAWAGPVGDGWVVLTGFDAMHRYQNHGNFALVWNAILHWNDLAAGWESGAAAVADDEADGEAAGDAAGDGAAAALEGALHGW